MLNKKVMYSLFPPLEDKVKLCSAPFFFLMRPNKFFMNMLFVQSQGFFIMKVFYFLIKTWGYKSFRALQWRIKASWILCVIKHFVWSIKLFISCFLSRPAATDHSRRVDESERSRKNVFVFVTFLLRQQLWGQRRRHNNVCDFLSERRPDDQLLFPQTLTSSRSCG